MPKRPGRIVINVEIRNRALVNAMDKERAPLEWSRGDIIRALLRQRYRMPVGIPAAKEK